MRKVIILVALITFMATAAFGSQGILVTNGDSVLDPGKVELSSIGIKLDHNDLMGGLGFRAGILTNLELEVNSEITNGVSVGKFALRADWDNLDWVTFVGEIEGLFVNQATMSSTVTTTGWAFDKNMRYALAAQGQWKDLTFAVTLASQKNGDADRSFTGEAYLNYVYNKIMDATLEFRQEDKSVFDNSIAFYIGIKVKSFRIQAGILKLPGTDLDIQPVLQIVQSL